MWIYVTDWILYLKKEKQMILKETQIHPFIFVLYQVLDSTEDRFIDLLPKLHSLNFWTHTDPKFWVKNHKGLIPHAS